MRIIGRAAGQLFLRAVLCSFLLGTVCAGSANAQEAGGAAKSGASKAVPGLKNPADKVAGDPSGTGSGSGLQGTAILDAQWKFHTGDDPLWADPALDDASWPAVNLSQSLVEQG